MKLQLEKRGYYKVKISITERTDLLYLVDDLLKFVGGYERVKIDCYPSTSEEESISESVSEISYEELSEEDDIVEEQPNIVEQLGGSITTELEEIKSEQPIPQPIPDPIPEPQPVSQNHINLKNFCDMKEPFETKEDFKKALSLTTLSPGGHKNYMFAWNCPLWSKVGSPNDIFDYLRQRTNSCETSSQFQELYKLFTLFFKFNDLRGYITEPKDLLTLKDLFDPVKSKKNSVSQKKKLPNATN